jgi:hypothetical protein
MNTSGVAFGAPGIEPRWTSSAKEGLGTAYSASSRLWFTLSHGIINEVYYPSVDQPNTRDFQFLISDGATFCHEEKRDLDHRVEYPDRDTLFYRLTNSERSGRYRITKEILSDPYRSVLLIHTKVDLVDDSLRGKLSLYALLAPHIARYGAGNSGWSSEIADLPDGSMKFGQPTGAAMPLCWSHAEYITLVRSRHDGVCFDRVEPAFQRYVVQPAQSSHEIWSFRHQLRRIPHQKTLRIIVGAPATVVWSADSWATTNRSDTLACPGLNLQFVDLPTNTLASGRVVEFTFFWTADQRWEGRNWQIAIQ